MKKEKKAAGLSEQERQWVLARKARPEVPQFCGYTDCFACPDNEPCPVRDSEEGLREGMVFEALVAARLAEGVLVEERYAGRTCRRCGGCVPKRLCPACRLRVARLMVEEESEERICG